MVGSYCFDTYCSKNRASFFTHHAGFYGDRRGLLLLILLFVLLSLTSKDLISSEGFAS